MSDCHDSPAGAATAAASRNPDAPKRHVVAIVGPPNSGKSTLFNVLTGLRQKVANFPGVTVERHIGKVKTSGNREIVLVDLPGVYSLTPRSEDERVTRDVLTGADPEIGLPDAVLLILDSTNLNRHLILAAPVLSIGLPTLVILNMADELATRGGNLDPALLAMQLATPVALISASKKQGIDKVLNFLEGASARPAKPVKRVELPVLNDVPKCRQWAGQMGAGAAYKQPSPPLWTRRLDSVLLHPVAGPLIFLAVVVALFQSIFTWAKPIMDGMTEMVARSGTAIGALIPNELLRSLVIDGVWKGVGSVIVFLPQILLLFLFIGILEDSGYLARAALIADSTMARVGLQGKAFIPLLSAYACAVPAIMATRTIENKRDRLATILIAPLMTCSARFPVYALVIAAFIPDTPVIGGFLHAPAAVLLGLYALGFVAAILTARVLKSTILQSKLTSFVLEIPPYRMPTIRSLALRLVDRARVFLRRAGTVILAVAVGLWALAHLPLENGKPPELDKSYVAKLGHAIEPAIKPLGFNWKIGIGLITSLFAREVIVGTLATIYGIEGATHESKTLQVALHEDLSFAGSISLLVFFAFALQCFSTIAVVRRETGGWKWPAIQFVYMTTLAYVGAFAAFRIFQ